MKTERKQIISNQYDNVYTEWKGWKNNFGELKKNQSAYFSKEISRTKHDFPKKSKILEIGFGNGCFLTYAQRNDWEVCGTEVNEALVNIARQKGFAAIYTKELSSFDDNTFNLVVAFDVLEHVEQWHLSEFISEIKRVLKNDGIFIARVPNGDSPLGLANQNGDMSHLSTLGSGKLRHLAAKANMKIIFLGGQAQPILGTSAAHFVHRLFTLPFKLILNLIINLTFFPMGNIAYCSPNLVLILKAVKSTNTQI